MTSPAPVVGASSPQRLIPYISTDMFMYDGRRGVSVDQLAPGGKDADVRAALEQYIESASAWVDSTAQQILAATVDTQVLRANVNRRGFVVVHPRYRPVIAVVGFSIGPTPALMVPYSDLSGIGVAEEYFQVPVFAGGVPVFTSQGRIQFGNASPLPGSAWVQPTYQNGYPVTTLTAAASAGAVQLSVADTTGIVENQTYLVVYAGKRRWRFLAGSVSTSGAYAVGTGPGTVGCPPVPWDLPTNTASPVMVSALPADIIQAMVLITRAFIKDAGTGNISSPAIANNSAQNNGSGIADDLEQAAKLIQPYQAALS